MRCFQEIDWWGAGTRRDQGVRAFRESWDSVWPRGSASDAARRFFSQPTLTDPTNALNGIPRIPGGEDHSRGAVCVGDRASFGPGVGAGIPRYFERLAAIGRGPSPVSLPDLRSFHRAGENPNISKPDSANQYTGLLFEAPLDVLVDVEWTSREKHRQTQRLKAVRFRLPPH